MSRAQTQLVWMVLVLFGAMALYSSTRADILDDFKKNREVAAQKLEKEVEQAILDVQKLKTKDPAKALGILNTYKAILEGDTYLTKKRRDELLQAVGQQIQIVQVAAKSQPDPVPPKKKPSVDDLYEKYQKANPGKATGSPSDTASKYFNEFKSKIDAAKGYGEQKNKVIGQVYSNSLDFGDIPSNGYVSYAKDWKAKSDLRLEMSGIKLSKEEASLAKAMNSVLSIDFDKRTFRQVIDYLSERTGQVIIVDPQALKELMLSYDTPVSFSANKITFRTALKKVLGDVGLAYILKDGTVQVVTPQVAANSMTVRAYYIGDLLPVPDPRFGPFFNEAKEQYYANQVMQMIVMTVEPSSWAVNNGQGTIMYNPISKSIVIRNSAEMHLSIKGSIGR